MHPTDAQDPPSDPGLDHLGYDSEALVAGATLGRYRLEREVGRGAMGVLWKAWDEELSEPVALKFLPRALVLDQVSMRRLRAEAKILLALTHDRIVRLRTLESDGAHAWLVMEYLAGPTLLQVVEERLERGQGGLTAAETIWVIEEVASALDYAHEKNVTHRDIKPGNMMLTRSVEGAIHQGGASLKLTDFGIAFVASSKLTQMSGFRPWGTLPYMAPEVLEGKRPTPAADVYGLGATLFALVQGDPPFTHGDLSLQIRQRAAPCLDSGDPNLDRAVAAALAKDPARRPRSAVELLRMARGERPPSRLSRAVAGRSGPVTFLEIVLLGMLATLLVAVGLPRVAERAEEPARIASAEPALASSPPEGAEPEPAEAEPERASPGPADAPGDPTESRAAAAGPAQGPPPNLPEVRAEPAAVERTEPASGPAEPAPEVEREPPLALEPVPDADGRVYASASELRIDGRLRDVRFGAAVVTLDAPFGRRESVWPIDAEGRFGGALPLGVGESADVVLVIEGLDQPVRFEVVQDPEPPAIELLRPSPDAPALSRTDTIDVHARVADEHAVSVACGGVELERNGVDGFVARGLELPSEGVNTIVLVAQDLAGNRTELAFDVTRDTRAPVLSGPPAVQAEDLVAGRTLPLELRFDEPLGAFEIAGTAFRVDGARATGELAIPDEPGEWEVEWIALDALGNAAHGGFAWSVGVDRWGDASPATRAAFDQVEATPVRDGERSYPRRIRHVATGLEFVYVPRGEFWFGTPVDDPERSDSEIPARRETSGGFYVARTPVTVAAWRRGFGARPAGGAEGDLPVTEVTWREASDWCASQGFALPSEVEWEYAASGPGDLTWPWGDTWEAIHCNAAGTNARDRFEELGPAGFFGETGASWVGACDMAGGVWEWCRDLYAEPSAAAEGAHLARDRALRGGSYRSFRESCRTSSRRPLAPGAARSSVGFRPIFVP